jgi:hypothetical protein
MIKNPYKSSSIKIPKKNIACSIPINITNATKKESWPQEIDYDLNGQINDPFTNSPNLFMNKLLERIDKWSRK